MPITQISTTGIADGAITASKLDPNSVVIPPTVTQIQITDSSYVVLDDTAVSTSGGYIKITGTGFTASTTVVIGSATASAVSYVSSTTLNVQVPAQSAGTYTVYVVNTNGSVGIVVNGLNYSGSPTWVTTSPLPQGTSGSPISIQLSATGDAPLTYALQAGSTLPSGLTLTSSGLLSGTVVVGAQTTYNFTIVASDAQLQDTPQAFAIIITSGDAYWSYVTTLLSASTPLSLPFNDDASTNNFAMTINGDTKPNNFNPYTPGYYSNYFDGSGDYFTVPGTTEFAFGTGSWTVEFWVYPLAYGGSITGAQLFGTTNGAQNNYSINLGQDINSFRIISNASGTWADNLTVSAGGGPELNTWSHMAISRNGANISIYKNGTRVATSASAIAWNFSGTTGVIGRFNDGSNTKDYNGYISNLRVVKGSAVYDPTQSTITVPTSPLTAITNTSLLTCQSNRFIDNSTNNFTITVNGNTAINSLMPFVLNSSYSTYGSTYFDGSGDFLSTPTGPAAFDFSSTKTLTLEFWINSPAWGGGTVCFFDLQECQPFRVLYTAGTLSWQATSSGGTILSASITLAVNVWYHIAFVRNTDTLYMFVNGVQVATGAYSTTWGSTASGNVRIGCNRGDVWFVNGYMTDVRLVKGTALYTSAFTPPISPLTAISGTSLLTCQTVQPVNNNVFIDNSSSNSSITRNGNATQGTFSPYGGGFSNYFDGNGDYLRTTGTALNATTFTISFYFYPTTSSVIGLFDSSPGNASTFRNYPANTIQDQNDGNVAFTALTNQWNWMSIVGSNGTFTVYLNGSSVGSGSYSNISVNNFTIGTINSGGDGAFTGYISNFRIKNVASVDAIPSTPLQPVAGTTLLTCQSPNIVDNSPNNFTLTRTGDVSVQKFSPFSGTTLPTPYYSASFNGSSDYLSLNSYSTLATTTTPFTLECWVYPTTQLSGTGIITQNFSGSGTIPFAIFGATNISTNSSGSNLCAGHYTGSAWVGISSSSTLTLNIWSHIALVFNGTVATLYLNGTSIGTSTTSWITGGNTPFYIGRRWDTTATPYFAGYISNVRFVNGTAVYTSAFTPPTAPLTAITNTQLLTCQSNTFIDNSTNNYAITAGTTTVKPTTFNPFTVAYSILQSYTPSVYGGSMYFDGTGDWLSIPSNPVFTFVTDFTIEAWVYPTVINANNGIISRWTTSLSFIFKIVTAGRPYFAWNIGGTGTVTGTSTAVLINQWNHVAVTRSGSTVRLFVNGIVDATTGTASGGFTASTSAITISALDTTGTENWTGNISDIRVVNGTALYTSNFVPSNAPLTAIRNTVFLANGTSAGIYDSSEMANFETIGDAKLSVTTVKFSGSTSIYFDGTGDYLSTSTNLVNFAFGTGDFTVEMWVYQTSLAVAVLIDFRGATSNVAPSIELTVAGKVLIYKEGTGTLITTTNSITAASWTHVAVTRSGTSLKVFINGVQDPTTATDSTNWAAPSGKLTIGANKDAGSLLNGYLSDTRITKGIARYTSNFTVPTTPFMAK